MKKHVGPLIGQPAWSLQQFNGMENIFKNEKEKEYGSIQEMRLKRYNQI